jgi:hypothetical protein
VLFFACPGGVPPWPGGVKVVVGVDTVVVGVDEVVVVVVAVVVVLAVALELVLGVELVWGVEVAAVVAGVVACEAECEDVEVEWLEPPPAMAYATAAPSSTTAIAASAT